MNYVILKRFDEVSDYVSQVSAIADANKKAFGFLSTSAYEQMASKGQLWIAVGSSKELKGYLMFGGTMPTLKVFQVYACESVKGQGVARQLIDTLKEYAREKSYHSILARVASDLPANGFWENVGFTIYRQDKGGKTTRRIINIRGYSLEENDLFWRIVNESNDVKPAGPVLKRPVYALDLNLLLDVAKAREGYKGVVKIMRIGFQGEFSICITPEFKKELERQSAELPDDFVLRFAEAFPELKPVGDVPGLAESLRSIVFPLRTSARKSAQNDESDLMHLAYCISADVGGFITRDKALLRACDKIKDRFGVFILSPDELILDDGDDAPSPLSSDFQHSVSSITDEVREFLASFSVSDPITDILAEGSPTKGAGNVYEARLDGRLFGISLFQKPIKTTGNAIAALYLDESCSKSIAVIDHFLETTLRYKSGFPYRLDLYIGKDQSLTEETLRKKGFFGLEDHFVKIVCDCFLDKKSWGNFASSVKSLCSFTVPEKLPSKEELINTGIVISDSSNRSQVFPWFDFETVIGPRFILTADRGCILVSIQEKYALDLIGNVTNQMSLLSSNDKTFLLEKAYFRSPKNVSIFNRGGIIAFYVSGDKSIQEIVGFARITYSDVINIDEAMVKVNRQGVLSHSDLSKIADKSNSIHVFTFDNFLEFDCKVPFARAKELGLISGANLNSPERINFRKLKVLIGEAFNE